MQQQRPQKGRAVRQRRGATQRARRRRRMLIIFYLLLFLFLVVAAISLSLTVLFRISRIEVRNESIYTQEEILQACAISEGENLFLADVDGARGRIETQLPYTAQVTVERDFPSGITVTVGQATVSAALIQKDGTVLLIGADHKILEQVSAVPPGVLQVSGLQVQDPTPGYRARWEDEETASVFFALQQEMQEGELSPITSMDVGDLYRLTVVYDSRITVNFGGPDDLQMKVAAVKKILTREIGGEERGTLDASLTRDSKRVYFKPEESSSPQKDPPDEPSSDPESEPSSNPEREPSTDPESEPSTDPESEPPTDPESEPSSDPESEPSSDPESEPSSDPESEPSSGDEP